VDGPLPLGTVSADFPNDRYEANYYVGCNFLPIHSEISLGGNIPGPTDNYQASWSLNNDTTFLPALSKNAPPVVLNDTKNMNYWLKLNLVIFHRPPFPEYVGVLVNQVPLWLGVFGVFLAVVIFVPVSFDLLKKRSSKNSRANLIEGILIPISAAVIVFVPVYMLALHAFEAPLLIMSLEANMVRLLKIYLVVLGIGVILRFFASRREKSPIEIIPIKGVQPPEEITQNLQVTLPEDKKEKKNDLEKLIDWEQNKQLTWAVVLLTAALGLGGLFVGNSFSMGKEAFVIILSLVLMLVLDLSFYRLVTSLVFLRKYIEWIGQISDLFNQELVKNAVFSRLYGWFVETAGKDDFHLKKWRVILILGLVDAFIVAYLVLMTLRFL
jgi:hypothetical protein